MKKQTLMLIAGAVCITPTANAEGPGKHAWHRDCETHYSITDGEFSRCQDSLAAAEAFEKTAATIRLQPKNTIYKGPEEEGKNDTSPQSNNNPGENVSPGPKSSSGRGEGGSQNQ